MSVVWPATLPPTFDQDSYGEQPPDTTIRTSMDAGPPKVRRRFTAGSRPLQGTMLLTPDQAETLDSFYVNDTKGGSLAFDFVHPRTGITKSVRFLQAPGISAVQCMFRASIALEILP